MQAGPYSYRLGPKALPQRGIRGMAGEASDARLGSSHALLREPTPEPAQPETRSADRVRTPLSGRHFVLLHPNRTRVRMLLGTNRSSHDRPIGRQAGHAGPHGPEDPRSHGSAPWIRHRAAHRADERAAAGHQLRHPLSGFAEARTGG